MPSDLAKAAPERKDMLALSGERLTRLLEWGLYLTLASLALSSVALLNRAPLVFADTISYANAALNRQMPGFFSIFYSAFILPLHQGISLWPVVFIQGAIIAHLLYLTARSVTRERIGLGAMLATIAGLAIFSSLPWLTGQIMPDVFTPVVAIGLYLLAFANRDLSAGERLYVGALTALAISFHFSHVPLAAGLICLAIALRLLFKGRSDLGRIALTVVAPFLVALAALFAINWATSGEIRLAKNSNVFLLAKWIDEGPALDYLKDSCPNESYALCAHLDEFEGRSHAYLKWDANSPLKKVGSFDSLDPEAGEIVRGTLLSRPLEIVGDALINFGTQLLRFQTGDGLSQQFAQMVAGHLKAAYGDRVSQSLRDSRQGRAELPLTEIRTLHSVALALALAFLLYLLLFRREAVSPEFVAFAVFVLLAVGLNAAVTGALSGAYDRYLARVIWLIDFAALLGLYQLVQARRVPTNRG
jgi:hypothetical protein